MRVGIIAVLPYCRYLMASHQKPYKAGVLTSLLITIESIESNLSRGGLHFLFHPLRNRPVWKASFAQHFENLEVIDNSKLTRHGMGATCGHSHVLLHRCIIRQYHPADQ